MNVLVVGRGGREHSIVSHLKKSEQIKHLYAAPGNGGMEHLATCVQIDEMNIEGLVKFAKDNDIDLTIVGPENPLNAGIADRFFEENLPIFAPTKAAALLEGSKQFAKNFMKNHQIPTADFETFTNAEAAKIYVAQKGAPIVVKADGLAEGKGVVVAETEEAAIQAIDEMMVRKKFNDAGSTIVIEEFLEGREFSLMAFVHGRNVYPMVPARDHKRALDGDCGPNTGGMGAYAPVPDITEEMVEETTTQILQRVVDQLYASGRPFTGILYAGLMVTTDGIKVIEFNTRFGDPETQVVLPLLENDLLQVIIDVMGGRDPQLQWKNNACVGVVVASKGYPMTYEKNVKLPEFAVCNDSFVIQAGTKMTPSGLVSNGGRVFLVGAVGNQLEKASELAYAYLESLALDAYFYRQDIGRKVNQIML